MIWIGIIIGAVLSVFAFGMGFLLGRASLRVKINRCIETFPIKETEVTTLTRLQARIRGL